jgi:hypothetical protein
MRKLVALAALLVAATLPTAASAQFFVGARLGYAIPWGDVEKSAPLKDVVKSGIPLQLDLGLKLGKALAVGVYGGYAFLQQKTDCTSPASCSTTDLRFGAQANLHAANTEKTEFWGGVALGYEKINTHVSGGGSSADFYDTGYEAALQGGLDYLASPSFRVGPFASLSVGQYTKTGAKGGGSTVSGDITDKTFHGFITIGLRGMFGD